MSIHTSCREHPRAAQVAVPSIRFRHSGLIGTLTARPLPRQSEFLQFHVVTCRKALADSRSVPLMVVSRCISSNLQSELGVKLRRRLLLLLLDLPPATAPAFCLLPPACPCCYGSCPLLLLQIMNLLLLLVLFDDDTRRTSLLFFLTELGDRITCCDRVMQCFRYAVCCSSLICLCRQIPPPKARSQTSSPLPQGQRMCSNHRSLKASNNLSLALEGRALCHDAL